MLHLLIFEKLVFKVLYFFYFIVESGKLLIILKIIPFNRGKPFYIIVGHGLGSSWLLFQLCTVESMLIAYRIMLGWARVFVLFLGWEKQYRKIIVENPLINYWWLYLWYKSSCDTKPCCCYRPIQYSAAEQMS